MQNAKTKKTVKILLIFVRVPTVKLKNHRQNELYKSFESTLKSGKVSSEILLPVQSVNIKKTLSCILRRKYT